MPERARAPGPGISGFVFVLVTGAVIALVFYGGDVVGAGLTDAEFAAEKTRVLGRSPE